MKKVILSAMALSLTLTGCATTKEKTSNFFRDRTKDGLPTVSERDSILAELKTNGQLEKTPQNTWEWHQIGIYPMLIPSGTTRTVYVDTLNITRPYRNVASGYSKVVYTNGKYTISKYRVFCNQGYLSPEEIKHYGADNQRIDSIFTTKSHVYDHKIRTEDEKKIAKYLCTSAGF